MDEREIERMDSEAMDAEIINANPVITLITTEDGIPTSTEVTVLTTTLGDVPMMTASLGTLADVPLGTTHPTFVTSHPGMNTVYATSIAPSHTGHSVVVGEGQIAVLDSDGVQRTIVVHADPNQLSALAQVSSNERHPQLISVELQDALRESAVSNENVPTHESAISENNDGVEENIFIQEEPVVMENIQEVATQVIETSGDQAANNESLKPMEEISNNIAQSADENKHAVSVAVEDKKVAAESLEDKSHKQNAEPEKAVSAMQIPTEVVCLICYQAFLNPNTQKKDASGTGSEKGVTEMDISLKQDEHIGSLYGRTLGRFYEISRINMSIVTRRSYKDYEVPICQKCNKSLVEVETILEELRRLEREIYYVRQRIKEEIIASEEFYKNEENNELAASRRNIPGLPEILDVIDRIRHDIINDGRPPKIPKSISSDKKPGRKPKKSTNDGEKSTEETSGKHTEADIINTTQNKSVISNDQSTKEEPTPSTSSQAQDNKSADTSTVETKTEIEESKIKQPAFRTSFGRLIKRPTYMLTELTDDELSDLAENSEDNYEEIEVKPELPVMEGESGLINQDDIDEMDEEDPAWSPGRGMFISERVGIPPSSSDESDNLTEEESDSETVPKVKTKKEVKEKKARRKPRKYKRHVTKRQPTIKQEDMNYEVKVIQLDGTELMTINTTGPDENIGLEPEITQKVMDSQAVIMVKNQLFGKRVQCHHCSRTFTDPVRRDIHVKKKHEGVMKPFECDVCRKRFSRHDHLRNHMKRHTRPPREKSFKPKATTCEKNHSCEFCEQKFRNKSELAVHTRTHTGEKPYKCENCMEAFVSTLKREFHIEQMHPEVPPLRCDFCPKGFFRQHRLRIHAVTHTGEKANICELCGKSFSQAAMLRYHQTTHEELNLKQFKCQECNRVFANPQNLKSHMESQHQKMYRHRCPHCDRGYTQMSHLRRHLRTHSGEQPFTCSYCPKRFTSGAALKIHVRIHTGERPYWCSLCEKGFRSKTKLGRHLKTLIHSGENKDRIKKETVTSEEVESVDVNAAATTTWTEIVGIITGV